MNTLPASRKTYEREVFDMLIIRGLENVTKCLRMGDAFDLDNLRPLANRCRALADAFDLRMAEHEKLTEDE